MTDCGSNNVLKYSLKGVFFKIPFLGFFVVVLFFVVQNDHPAPSAHDTPKAYILSQTEAALLPQENSKVCDPGFNMSSYRMDFLQ